MLTYSDLNGDKHMASYSVDATTADVVAAIRKKFNKNTTNRLLYRGASINAAVINAAPTVVYQVVARNRGAATAYFFLSNKSTAVANGEAPTFSVEVPAGATVLLGKDDFGDEGFYYDAGLAFAWSTSEDTRSATLKTASECHTQVRYLG